MAPMDGSDVLSQILCSAVDEAVMRVLSAPQRRRVVYYLLDEERASLEELVDVVAEWQTASEDAVTPADRERLEFELYHRHLPRLDDADLVTFEPTDRAVERTSFDPAVRDLVQVTYLVERPDDAEAN